MDRLKRIIRLPARVMKMLFHGVARPAWRRAMDRPVVPARPKPQQEVRDLLIGLHLKLDRYYQHVLSGMQEQAIGLHLKLDSYHGTTTKSIGEIDAKVAEAMAETDRLLLAFLKSSLVGGKPLSLPEPDQGVTFKNGAFLETTLR